METLLQQIIDFATRAHSSQRRKFADEPYINHPVRVMKICRQHTHDMCVLSAALLHDVLEDTSTSKEQIHDFLKTVMSHEDCIRTLKLVVELTDVYTKGQYPDLNRRQRKAKEFERLAGVSAQAQNIKYADIIDNSQDISNAEAEFARIALHEYKTLVRVMVAGSAELRKKAGETVAVYLTALKQTNTQKK